MKFRITALAVAIAGIAAAPIASAETTLSGIVQIKFTGSDADDDPGTPLTDESDVSIAAGDINAGITTNHVMNNGLTAYGSLRMDFDALSNALDSNDDLKTAGTLDSMYVGAKGGFGDVRFGEIPSAIEYGQVAGDLNDIEGEINGGLSYTGAFGPVGLGVHFSPGNNSDSAGAGVKFNLGGFAVGVGAGTTDEVDKVSAGASFTYAGASIAAHFTQLDNNGAEADNIGVKVGYGIAGVSIGLTAHISEEADFENKLRLDLGYDLGGNMGVDFRLDNKTDSTGGADDSSAWRIQMSKSF